MYVVTYLLLCVTVICNAAVAGTTTLSFDFTRDKEQFFIAAPQGYTLGEYTYLEGGSILIQMEPGEGLLLYGPVISGGDGVSHIQCSVSSTQPGVQIVLGALNIPLGGELGDSDGSIGANYGTGDLFQKWTELDLYYEPVNSSFAPVIQAVNPSSVAVDVYLAGLTVTPLFEFTATDLGELLDIPTPRPTPVPPYSGAGTPVYCSANGHYYAIIEGRYTWFQAQWEAGLLLNGSGYMATVTSQAENDFLLSTFGSERLVRNWLGGIKAPLDSTSGQPVWHWANGEDWVYTNWAPGKPLYGGDDTYVLEFGSAGNYPGSWADRYINSEQGFIAEWDSDPFVALDRAGNGAKQLVPPDGSTIVVELDEPSEDIFITAPEGYEQAAYTYGEIPAELSSAVQQRIFSNGLGMTASLDAGQGITVYGPSIATGVEPVLVQCRIRTDTPGAAITLAVLNVASGGDLSTFNGVMFTNSFADSEAVTGQWLDIQLIYNQRDGDLVPVIQAVAASDNPVSVYIDRIVVTPLENLGYINAQEVLPIPTLSPTPTPVLDSWTVESYTVPNMLGEIRIQFVDVDSDGDRDILIANSATRDYDPSFQVMYCTSPGVYQSAEPLLGRDWVPGLHNEILLVPHASNLVLDVRAGSVYTISGSSNVTGAHLRIFNFAQRRYARFGATVFEQNIKEISEWGRARTIPIAIQMVPTENTSRVVASLGRTWDFELDSPNEMRLASSVYELEIDGDKVSLVREYDTTSSLDDPNDYLITSIALIDNRTFMLADTIFRSADDLAAEPSRGTSLLELVNEDTILPIISWPEGNGGHLATFNSLHGSSDPRLVVRYGSTVRIYWILRDSEPIEQWVGSLDEPRISGGFLLGHSTPKRFQTHLKDDALAMTFQGELIPGDFNNDGFLDLLSYANGLEYLPGINSIEFGASIPLEMNFYPTDVCVDDMDGDGDDDIIASSGNELRLYFQNGSHQDSNFVLPPVPHGEVTTLAGDRFVSGPIAPIQVGTEFQQARRLVMHDGEIFVSDTAANRIMRCDANGYWHQFYDDTGTDYQLSSPTGLYATDDSLLICDSGHHRVLKYAFDSESWSLVAGTGDLGHSGDGNSASSAFLNYPCDLAELSDGRILIADTGNHALRVVNLESNIIDSFFPEDFDPQLDEPVAIVLKNDDEIFVTEYKQARIRRFYKSGDTWNSEVVAGHKRGENGLEMASETSLLFPEKMVLLPDGRLLIADTGNQRLLLWSENGYKWLAGSGIEGFQIDGVPLNVFHFSSPSDIVIQSATEYIVADDRSLRLLRIGVEALQEVPLPWIVPTPTPSPTPTAIPINDQGIAGPVRWDHNGHYYALVAEELSWTEARQYAQQLFDEMGDLATVTSSLENNFLVNTFRWDLLSGSWLGAYQDERLDETSEILYGMAWRWVTGESWVYTYWGANRPDNNNDADYLAYEAFGGNLLYGAGAWNDYVESQPMSFVVEWDHDPLAEPVSAEDSG